MGFGIKGLSSIEIKEPRVKIKNKFLQKIFIKLFGYRTVCSFTCGGIDDAKIER